MIKRNVNLAKLPSGYLFPEINRRKKRVMADHPNERVISLGIGNTTEPITPVIAKALVAYANGLGTLSGYSGYGDEQGVAALRQQIAHVWYQDRISSEEVFVSDGAKCDIGRLQLMFGSDVRIGVQDPSYPVYVDGSVIMGCTQSYDSKRNQFEGIRYLACTPENDFFPDLNAVRDVDVLYFCSPNNPTGAVATKAQLRELVAFANRHKILIVFDAAYSAFIRDSNLPKSIFEIEGADRVAIEVNSFSKYIGFTGVRLGWTVVPKALKYDSGELVIHDWNRIMTTVFNGASNIAQYGGLSALTAEGLSEMKTLIQYYMENAGIIKSGLDSLSIKTFGGMNAPYIWAHFPQKKSWDVFEHILETAFVVTTPGSGFGPAGEGFLRFSAFGHRDDVVEAVSRLKTVIRNF